jgi:N-acetylneuraminate synthase
MSALDEIDAAVARIARAGVGFAVMQCTSAYPCPPERVGLNMLASFRQRYDCPVGLSDHSGTIFPGLAAATLGAELLELHVAFSKECFGPDVVASVTTAELKTLVEGVRFIEKMRHSSIDKDAAAVEMKPLRALFTKSLFATIDLPEGAVLKSENLSAKKPGTGILADQLPSVVGRRLRKPLVAGEMLSESHLVGEAVLQSSRNE